MSSQTSEVNACIELSLDERTGIATICLNNSRRRNAFNGQMMQQLNNIIDQLSQWKTGKALIVYGKNGFFCSGIDLKFLAQVIDSKEAGILYSSTMVSNLSRLKALPLLSVAVINGMALGGGAEVAVGCDLRVMTRSAKIGFVHIKIGASTAWSGGCRLTQICGHTKALDLMLSGRVLTSEEAFDLGLVNHIFDDYDDDDLLFKDTKEWLHQFINNNKDQDQIIDIKNCSSYYACS